MKKTLLFLLLTLSSYSFAQNIVSGKVIGKDNKPIKYFNVAILNIADSSYQKGAAFIDGAFELQVEAGEFLLRISSLDYADKIIEAKPINLGNILLREREYRLDEVVVTAKAPTVKLRSGGGLDFNVVGTLISNAGTAMDVLKRTPFVMVDNGGGVSVIGRSSTIVLINGRKILDQQELSSLNSSDIKSIEVIENPSAKYEADGHSVVNIITTKRVSDFISGSVYLRANQGETFSYSANPELSLRLNKFSLYAGYTYSRSNSSGLNYNRYERTTPQGVFGTYSYDLKNKSKSDNQSYRAGVDYKLSTNSTIGAQYTGYNNRTNSDFLRNMEINRNAQSPYTQHYYRVGNRQPQNNVVSVYYDYQKEGFELNFVADYTSRNSNNKDNIIQTSDIYPQQYISLNESLNNNKLYSAKLDVVIPLKSIEAKIESGAKYSSVEMNSSAYFANIIDNSWVTDPALSYTVQYRESISALYAIFAGKLPKMTYSVGVRVEVNSVDNRREGLSGIKLTKTGIFPNLTVGYNPTNNLSTTFIYSRRISRPSYSDLSNNISYIDSLSFRVGNPDLKPVYFNTFSLNNTLFKKFIVNLSASYVEQPYDMRFINYGTNGESQLTIMENSPNRWSMSATVGALFKHKIWSTQIYASFVYEPSSIIDDNVKYTFYNNSYSLQWFNQIALPKGWALEVNSTFFQPGGTYMTFGKQLSADVSVSKKLLKDRLSLQLSSYNQLFKWTQHYRYSHKLFNMTYNDLNRNTCVLTLRYNFTTIRPAFRSKNTGYEEKDRM